MRSATTWPRWSSDGGTSHPSFSAPAPAMPTGVALTTRSACATSASSPNRAHPAHRAGQGGHRVRPLRRPVHAPPHRRSRRRPAPPRPPGPPLRRPGSGNACRRDRRRPPEPARPGIRPRRCSPPAGVPSAIDDTVDRPQGGGHVAALVHQCGRSRLVGHGHRDPGQPERPHPVQRTRHPSGRHLEGERGPVETQDGKGRVVEEGRQRMPDRVADHPDQRGASSSRITRPRVAWPASRWPTVRHRCRRRPRCRPCSPARSRATRRRAGAPPH